MIRRVAVLVLLTCVGTSAAIAAQSDPETMRLLLTRAQALLRVGDATAALAALDSVLTRSDGVNAASPVTLRLLTQQALQMRAEVRWDAGDRDGVDDDFDRLISLDPMIDLGQSALADGLRERFTRRRERLVGFLTIGVSPADAIVRVDGEPLPADVEILPVLAGDHVVSAERRGFARQSETVEVRANRTEGVGLALERSSATIRVATIPAGARVVLDGEPVGVTAAIGDSPESAPLQVEGLLPGWHEIQINLANHRPFSQRFEVPALTDYDLGTLTMRLAVGTIALDGLPPGAEVWVDGETSTAGTRGNDGSLRLQLPVGAHEIVVGAPGGRVWAGGVDVMDGGTASRSITLRPGVALLGIVSDDLLDRENANAELRSGLVRLNGWSLLDRSEMTAGLATADVRAMAAGNDNEIRCRFEDEVPAGLFVIGTIDSQDPGVLRLRVWASGTDLPAAEFAVRRGLDDTELVAAFASLTTPLPAPRAWHGIVAMDGMTGLRVAAVTTGSPAASAGLLAGDRILSVDGAETPTVTILLGLLDTRMPLSSLLMRIDRHGETQDLRINLGSSPQVTRAPDALAALSWWARAAAGIGAGGNGQPVWSLHVQQALLLLDAGLPRQAAEMLWDAAPPPAPFGQAAIDYWLGITLSTGPEADFGAARNALNRAALEPEARLYYNDGPLLGARARARLARIAER